MSKNTNGYDNIVWSSNLLVARDALLEGKFGIVRELLAREEFMAHGIGLMFVHALEVPASWCMYCTPLKSLRPVVYDLFKFFAEGQDATFQWISSFAVTLPNTSRTVTLPNTSSVVVVSLDNAVDHHPQGGFSKPNICWDTEWGRSTGKGLPR